MVRPRDSQRQKLYTAEKVLTKFSAPVKTVPEMQAFLEKVLSRAPIQRRYGAYIVRDIEVKDGRRCRSALGGYDWIKMPRWARTQYIVLHEVAHSITSRRHGYAVAAHGREYAAIYLDLVHFGLGKPAADALKAAFTEHRVRFRPKRGAPAPALHTPPAPRPPKPPKPPKPVKPPSRPTREHDAAKAALHKLTRAYGFRFSLERDGTLIWISTSPFGPFKDGWTTLHYDWTETLRRLHRCLVEPWLVDADGGYSE